jgi:hypothetical protein
LRLRELSNAIKALFADLRDCSTTCDAQAVRNMVRAGVPQSVAVTISGTERTVLPETKRAGLFDQLISYQRYDVTAASGLRVPGTMFRRHRM